MTVGSIMLKKDLSVPGWVVILGTKTLELNKIVHHQHAYTDYVALVFLGEWVSP